ncbi:hypothetical protein ACFOET_17690 [Parapedobacter deserti]|uniref:Uncharacterized protein n=1 Tax=Parapedobacter deserti TaxID=1912957 RepID=A0ABV7JN09_9SPHI
MKLVQVFVPLVDNDGNRFPEEKFKDLQSALTEKFGGITVYRQMSIEGLWKETNKRTDKDMLAIFEVLADVVDTDYWEQLKARLATKFRQKDLLIRYWEVTTI